MKPIENYGFPCETKTAPIEEKNSNGTVVRKAEVSYTVPFLRAIFGAKETKSHPAFEKKTDAIALLSAFFADLCADMAGDDENEGITYSPDEYVYLLALRTAIIKLRQRAVQQATQITKADPERVVNQTSALLRQGDLTAERMLAGFDAEQLAAILAAAQKLASNAPAAEKPAS